MMNLHCWLHGNDRRKPTNEQIIRGNIVRWGRKKTRTPIAIVELQDEQVAMLPAKLSLLHPERIMFTAPIKCVMRGVRHPDRDDMIMWMERQFIMAPGDRGIVDCTRHLNTPLSIINQHPDIVKGCD